MLLDVNVLVALAWDSHVHHVAVRRWFAEGAGDGWATCSITELGFVRVCSNPKVLPAAIGVEDARRVLRAMAGAPGHRFLPDDVSPRAPGAPQLSGHRQVTDAHLLTLARAHGVPLVSFDRGLTVLASTGGLELLTA